MTKLEELLLLTNPVLVFILAVSLPMKERFEGWVHLIDDAAEYVVVHGRESFDHILILGYVPFLAVAAFVFDVFLVVAEDLLYLFWGEISFEKYEA
jgi:hypothetical protein